MSITLFWRSLAAAGLLFGLAACGDDEGAAANQELVDGRKGPSAVEDSAAAADSEQLLEDARDELGSSIRELERLEGEAKKLESNATPAALSEARNQLGLIAENPNSQDVVAKVEKAKSELLTVRQTVESQELAQKTGLLEVLSGADEAVSKAEKAINLYTEASWPGGEPSGAAVNERTATESSAANPAVLESGFDGIRIGVLSALLLGAFAALLSMWQIFQGRKFRGDVLHELGDARRKLNRKVDRLADDIKGIRSEMADLRRQIAIKPIAQSASGSGKARGLVSDPRPTGTAVGAAYTERAPAEKPSRIEDLRQELAELLQSGGSVRSQPYGSILAKYGNVGGISGSPADGSMRMVESGEGASKLVSAIHLCDEQIVAIVPSPTFASKFLSLHRVKEDNRRDVTEFFDLEVGGSDSLLIVSCAKASISASGQLTDLQRGKLAGFSNRT